MPVSSLSQRWCICWNSCQDRLPSQSSSTSQIMSSTSDCGGSDAQALAGRHGFVHKYVMRHCRNALDTHLFYVFAAFPEERHELVCVDLLVLLRVQFVKHAAQVCFLAEPGMPPLRARRIARNAFWKIKWYATNIYTASRSDMKKDVAHPRLGAHVVTAVPDASGSTALVPPADRYFNLAAKVIANFNECIAV